MLSTYKNYFLVLKLAEKYTRKILPPQPRRLRFAPLPVPHNCQHGQPRGGRAVRSEKFLLYRELPALHQRSTETTGNLMVGVYFRVGVWLFR